MDSNYSALYKSWPTDKLFDILENSVDYQPNAVEAAEREIESRKLTPQQVEEAREIQKRRIEEKESKSRRANVVEEKIKAGGILLAETFNFGKTHIVENERYIRIISIFLTAVSLYKLYDNFGIIKFMVIDNVESRSFGIMVYVFPIVFTSLGGIFMWLKKRAGWIISAIYFSSSALGAFALMIASFRFRFSNSWIAYMIIAIFFSALIWFHCKSGIRAIYQISRRWMNFSIGAGIAIVILIYYNLAI